MDGEEEAVEELDGGVGLVIGGYVVGRRYTVRRSAVARRVVADHIFGSYTLLSMSAARQLNRK